MSTDSHDLSPKPMLALLEDDQDFRASLELEFSERGYQVFAFESLAELVLQLKQLKLRFAIIDLRLKGDSGLMAVDEILAVHPACRIVVLTGYGSIATAVDAIKRGAVNYLTKPVSIERLEKALWIELDADSGTESEENIESLDRHEQEYIEYVLLQCDGNISQAARWLGIHRQSLQRKLKRIGLR